MSVQTGLRDLGRNNTSDFRGMALKKGAAPPPHRATAKSAAAVHATFISPPRNTPVVPANANSAITANKNNNSNATIPSKMHNNSISGSYSNAPMSPMLARAVENENAMLRAAYNPRLSRTDYSLTSGDLDASLPSGVSDSLPYPAAAACERGSGLRSVSDVPVLSMGCEEEPRRLPSAAESLGSFASGVRGAGRISPLPVTAAATAPPAVVFVPGATPEEEIVSAFLATCVGRVVETACTPHGKALLVAALETERPEVLTPAVAEVCEGLREVAVDANGCHVLRTLVEACTAEQTEALIAAMYPSVVLNICTTSQHTRLTLQSLFERRLVDLWPVVDVLAANAGYLAATQQGCISLMRVFERCDVEQKAALVHELLPKFAALSMDAFANYMVQCAIEHSDRTTAAQYVVQLFAGHLLQMSCDKFASNVVEKVVRVCGGVPAVRRLLLDELIFNPAALKEIVSDCYGNFVVQSVIEATTNAMEMKRVEDRLRPALVGCPFAAKIEAKLKAKRPGQTHSASNNTQQTTHQHPHQQHGQQTQRRTAYAGGAAGQNLHNVYGVPTNTHVQGLMGVTQRSSSYRMEGQNYVVNPAGVNAANTGAIAQNTSNNFRHRPYESPALSASRVAVVEAVQRYQDASAQFRGTPAMLPTAAQSALAAEVYGYAAPNARAVPVANLEAEAEDCGPVYGPSPAARRHLQQQQQQFRPPFSGAL